MKIISRQEEYTAEMQLPLRDPSRVKIVLCGGSPWTEVVIENLKIESFTETWDIDALSRRLPKYRSTLRLIDYDKVYSDPKWTDTLHEMRVYHFQTLADGSEEKVGLTSTYHDEHEPDVYNISKTENQNGITTITGQGYEYFVGYTEDDPSSIILPTAGTPDDILENLRRVGGLGYKIESVSTPIAYSLAYFPGNKDMEASKMYQLIANGWFGGFLKFVPKPENQYYSTYSVDIWNYMTQRSSHNYTLPITDFFKNSVTHKVSPSIKMIDCPNGKSPNSIEAQTVIGTADATNTNQVVVTVQHREAVDVTISNTDIAEIVSASLTSTSVEFYNPSVAGVVDILGKPVNLEVDYRMNVPVKETGAVDNMSNELITKKTMTDIIAPYCKYRHTITGKYRGDPSLEPGDDIKLQYTDKAGAYRLVPCLVLANEITYKTSMSGKIVLKILLTDDEIANF